MKKLENDLKDMRLERKQTKVGKAYIIVLFSSDIFFNFVATVNEGAFVCRWRSRFFTTELDVTLKSSFSCTQTTFLSLERPSVIPAPKNHNQIYQP